MADSTSLQVYPTSQLTPRRNGGLVARLSRLWARETPQIGPQPSQQETTQTAVVRPRGLVSQWSEYFKVANDRRTIYRDVDELDRNSEEISTALDTIADNLVTSEDGVMQSYHIECSDERANEVFDRVNATTNLPRFARVIARALVKYGDFFGEIVANMEGVAQFKALLPLSMNRNEDEYGNLRLAHPDIDPKTRQIKNRLSECAFEQVSPDDDAKLLAVFEPWQVVHIRHNWDGMSPYGSSQFKVSRITWKKLKMLEEALIIGRITRDLLKLVFYVDTTGLSPEEADVAVTNFQNQIGQRQAMDGRRENPATVMTDFFVTKNWIKLPGTSQPVEANTKVDVIDPRNEGLHEIQDIEYTHRKLLATGRVPAAHIGFTKDVHGQGVLTQQDVQYVRWLRSVQQEIGEALRQVYDLALIFEGIDPKSVEYTIAWPDLVASDEAAASQTELARAQADQLAIQEGILSPQWVRRHRYGIDDEEAQQIESDIEENQAAKLEYEAQVAASGAFVTATEDGSPGPATRIRPSAHRDRDGQRKGDEGRDRNGKRIAPTKSKRGVNNPTGTAAGKGRIAAEYRGSAVVSRRGAVHPSAAAYLSHVAKRSPLFLETLDRLEKPEPTRIVQLERLAEVGKRDPQHIHEYPNTEKPVLCFDLHDTLTPDEGFPLTSAPWPGVKQFLDVMVARGCCLHIATGSIDHYDPEIAAARTRMVYDWIGQNGLPISFVGPKVRAAAYVDDRGIPVGLKPDWTAIAQQAEKRLAKWWELNDRGIYVKRSDLTPKGELITDWPDIDEVPQDRPRGYSSPVIDFDVHRTVMPAWGSRRIAPPDPKAVALIRKLYDEGFQIHLSTAGINPATRSDQRAQMALASMRRWAQFYGIPYDRFVTHDDCELMFDDLMITADGDWNQVESSVRNAVSALAGTMPRAS